MEKQFYGMKTKEISFSDEEIASLFGHEAAEDERPERLREYYFKNDIYEQIVSDLPLKIVVGHKGIGKSALFRIAQQEFDEKNIITISLTPDDITGLSESSSSMLDLIRVWKEGLTNIIVEKVIEKIGAQKGDKNNYIGNIVSIIQKVAEQKIGNSIEKEKNSLINGFSRNKRIVIFIDDLDRGWEGKKTDIIRISAMLNAVRDLSRDNPTINFKVSLRTDVYYLYRTNDESTDKVESSVIWLTWNNFGILALLAKRIVTYFGGRVDEEKLLKLRQYDLAKILNYVFEQRFEGRGNWSEIPVYRLLTSLIRKRPRDLIKLCTLAAREARKNKKSKIGTNEFNNVFESYSHGRLQDTIIEFRSELPDIERLLTNMKPTKMQKKTSAVFKFKTSELLEKVRNIETRGKFTFTNGKVADTKDLCAFMYKINFLTARKDKDNEIIRIYFEENNFLMSKFADFGFDWEIHPAYRWALQPDNVLDILSSLPLYKDV